MGYTHFERLSSLDAAFLDVEDENCHMHIGAVGIFERGPLGRPDGGIAIERIRDLMTMGIHRIPRYRQRLSWIPVANHPVWIDDPRFNLNYHLRHTNLPHPGDERLLKRLVGRLMSQQLDRTKPLWEMWVIEGLEGNRVAVVTKVHHCMIDGIGGIDLIGGIMQSSPQPDPELTKHPPTWMPRPAPGPRELLVREIGRRVAEPLGILREIRQAIADPVAARTQLRDRLQGIGEALTAGLRSASPTPLNLALGPHRRFDWTDIDLGAVKAVKKKLGGTVNDVVLAILSGALRRFLHRRGVAPSRLDFRAMLPVSLRTAQDHDHVGNRVAMVVARLPLDEGDARRRLARVTAETRALKESKLVLGVQTLEDLSDRAFTTLFAQLTRLAERAQPYNIVVTNVPGPPFSLYLQGARMLSCFPVVPLFKNQSLGVALFSYDGRIHWGFNSDWDALPDLHELVEEVNEEFETLCEAAGLSGAPREEAARGENGRAHATRGLSTGDP
jgi:WS/DGAT/MGAT family acyltransferase